MAKIRSKLDLPTPFQLGKVGDAYASTLLWNDEAKDDIGQLM